MRGVADFSVLWERRTTLEMEDGTLCDLLSLPDLVKAKKTQRDKDWPMIRRLLEASFFANRSSPTPEQLLFWFHELRTPELLMEITGSHPMIAQQLRATRPAVEHAICGDVSALQTALTAEEHDERTKDQAYWLPLKIELERLRRR
jgi:hypothetical protein